MADVFLSYAKEDRRQAEQLAGALERSGWTVWWDGDLLPGDRYRDAIHRELNAAKCVVVLWSTTSVRSDYVLDEAGDGLARGVLLPVLIDEEATPPHGFRQSQWASLVGWDGWHEHPGLADLREGVARYVLPTPRPLVDDPYPMPGGFQGPTGGPPQSITREPPSYAPPLRSRGMRIAVFAVFALIVALLVGFCWGNRSTYEGPVQEAVPAPTP